MALWQFDILFVPIGAGLPVVTDEGCRTEAISPERCELAIRILSAKLGPAAEMMDGWFVFGPEDGSRFDVLLEEETSGEVSARVDAREQPERFLELVCDLAARLDCSIYALEFGKFIESEPEALCQALVLSRAASFVRDPAKVLLGTSDA